MRDVLLTRDVVGFGGKTNFSAAYVRIFARFSYA